MEGAIAAWCGLWRAMTTCFSPNSLEGHSLSCHGFGSPILGLFILVSAKLLSCPVPLPPCLQPGALLNWGPRGCWG